MIGIGICNKKGKIKNISKFIIGELEALVKKWILDRQRVISAFESKILGFFLRFSTRHRRPKPASLSIIHDRSLRDIIILKDNRGLDHKEFFTLVNRPLSSLCRCFPFCSKVFHRLNKVILNWLIMLGQYLGSFLEVETGLSFGYDKTFPQTIILQHGMTHLVRWLLLLRRLIRLLLFTTTHHTTPLTDLLLVH